MGSFGDFGKKEKKKQGKDKKPVSTTTVGGLPPYVFREPERIKRDYKDK